MGMWTIPDGPEEHYRFSTEEIDDFISTLAKLIVCKEMSVPAVMVLEMARPLSFVGYSALVIFGPLLDLLFDPVKMEKFQAAMADRIRIEQLIRTIEDLENNKKETKEGNSSEQQ